MKKSKIILITLLLIVFAASMTTFVACKSGGGSGKTSTSASQSAGKSQSTSTSVKEEVTLSSIAVTHSPDKTDYLAGQSFDASGMEVTAYYSDGTSKTVNTYTYAPTGALTATDNTVTISYAEKGVTKTTALGIVIGQPSDDSVRAAALVAVTEAFDKLDIDDYSAARFQKLVEALNEAVRSIKKATTNEGIEKYKNDAIATFENAVTIEKALEGTFINTFSGNYEFDRDDQGHLLIQYNGYPGSWKYVGNKAVSVDIKTQNALHMTVKNTYDQNIKVNLKLTDGGEYEVETGVTTLRGNETREFVLTFSYAVKKFYFFVDSCDTHDHAGEVAVLDTHFEFDPTAVVDVTLYDSKTVTFNKTITTEVSADYVMTEDDHAFFIDRIDVVGKVYFHGNGDNKKYFGLGGTAGNNKVSVSDGEVHAATLKEGDGNNYAFNIPIDEAAKLSTGSKVTVAVRYNAEGLTFTVDKMVFHYTTWDPVVSEKVTFGANEGIIYNNGTATATFEVPYSKFEKKGRVMKAELEFEMTNSQTYGKSQIYIKGLQFNNNIGNNVLNTGSQMDKSDGSTPKTSTGTFTVYPTDENTVLTTDGVISFDCWWASASYVKVKSITLYTVSMQAPGPVPAVNVRGLDSSVYLSWDKAEGATEYRVLVNGAVYTTTNKSYCIVSGLENGVEYSFTVIAKNSTGEAAGVSANGVPATGESFDAFIDTVDATSNLQNLIGDEKMQVLYDKCVYNEGNNTRLLNAINKMRDGVSQTFCYVGGSITVGENATLKDSNKHQKGYAYYSYQWLKETYDSASNSKYVNAAISGTGSEVGVVRAPKDVYDHNPDVIFIEYAANNSSVDFYRDTFEGIVRSCLNLPNSPAVILVVSCTTYTHNSGATKYIYQVGKYYDLPVFSIDAGLYDLCEGELKTSNKYFNAFISDGTHPNDEGHVLYGKCLASFLRRVINKTSDGGYTVKDAPLFTANYEGMVAIDSKTNTSVIKSMGSFVGGDTSTTCTSKQSDVTAFQQGFKKTSTTENNAMVIEVKCKNFIIVYCNSNPASHGSNYVFGTVLVKVTNLDTQATSQQTFDIGPGGWDNPKAVSIIDENASANYRIEISFTAATGTGNLFAMGYTA